MEKQNFAIKLSNLLLDSTSFVREAMKSVMIDLIASRTNEVESKFDSFMAKLLFQS